jgi:small redox-active disulfide protein 2
MLIKICGPGCAKCEEAANLVKFVAGEIGADAQIEKVTDFQQIAKLGVFSTPAVVIDGNIKCVGRVPSREDVVQWLKK